MTSGLFGTLQMKTEHTHTALANISSMCTACRRRARGRGLYEWPLLTIFTCTHQLRQETTDVALSRGLAISVPCTLWSLRSSHPCRKSLACPLPHDSSVEPSPCSIVFGSYTCLGKARGVCLWQLPAG